MHVPGERTGVILMNTGSAEAPNVPAVRTYLRQFLSDPRVIDIPAWQRWLLVNCIILPFRPKKTAHAYRAVWTENGAPLLAHSHACRDALAKLLPAHDIELGMAYGEPSIPQAIEVLTSRQAGRIVLAPMFPQYASATTGSVLSCAYEFCTKQWNVPPISVLPPFYDDPGFLDAWKAVAAYALAGFDYDHLLLSYHGLPERQVRKCDPSGRHCLASPGCCDALGDANYMCYRRHCMETTRALAARLGLEEGRYTVTFQSRLGRDPWLGPATDETITRLAKQGVKKLAVISPAFVADCLETLEEIGIGGKEDFIEHGGREFLLVPSLNAHPAWIEALANMIRRL